MGETMLLEGITVADAERLSNRIGLKLDSMADTWLGALPLIRESIERNVFQVLGYASHGAYVSDRFGDSLAKLGVDMRREVVRELSDAGLSTRAIAPVFGVNNATVHRDLGRVASATPEPGAVAKKVTGIDGKAYKPRKPKAEPAFVPSVEVPEGDDPFEYESECHVDPSGGVNSLKQLLKGWDKFLTNYYTNPSRSQLNVISNWLDKHDRKTAKATRTVSPAPVAVEAPPAVHGRVMWSQARYVLDDLATKKYSLAKVNAATKNAMLRDLETISAYVAETERATRPGERTGATDWSRRIQNISASIPMETLTQDELLELRGAAEFLHNYTKGEQATRKGKTK